MPAFGRTRPVAAPASAAVAALAVAATLSSLAIAIPGASAGTTPSTTVYLSAASATSLTTSHRLTPTAPSRGQWIYNDTDKQTGWLELRSDGTSPAAPTSATPPAPDGHGYLWDSSSLEGDVIPAGAWSATLSLMGNGTLTATPVARFFVWNSGTFTPIGTLTGPSVRLGSKATTVTLPSANLAGVAFGTGDRLYVDLLADVTTASCCRGNGIENQANVGSTAAVSFPSAVPAGTASASAPAAAPVTSSAAPAPAPSTSSAAPAPTSPSASPSSAVPSASASSPAPAPVTSASASPTTAPATTVWHPKPGTTWQWQITGTVDTSLPVQMYDIDLYDAQPAASSYTVPGFGTVNVPKGVNAGVIGRLHAQGKVVICYLDSGAWENYRPDEALFPAAVIGNTTGWSGERWLDIRSSAWSEFEPLIAARFDLAKRSGCDGVEPDQNNPWGNNPGFPISLADQKAWYLEVAKLAHARGLSVGQKNGIETTDAQTIAAFDWDLNEECRMYSECGVLDGYIAAGKAVFHAEYADEGMTTSFCPADNAEGFSGLLKYLSLNAWQESCQ